MIGSYYRSHTGHHIIHKCIQSNLHIYEARMCDFHLSSTTVLSIWSAHPVLEGSKTTGSINLDAFVSDFYSGHDKHKVALHYVLCVHCFWFLLLN